MISRKRSSRAVLGLLLLAISSVALATDVVPETTGTFPDDPAVAEETAGSEPVAAVSSSAETAKLIACLTVFVLAIFVGFEVITKVPPTLHTPLMSGSNAISGITVIGALILAGVLGNPLLAKILAFIALTFATINVVGGFLVTDRMLRMFKRR
jgi:NAD(P) transhydrogenase subunit alpha